MVVSPALFVPLIKFFEAANNNRWHSSQTEGSYTLQELEARSQCTTRATKTKDLNEAYNRNPFPSEEERLDLAKALGLSPRGVKVWCVL